MEQLVFGVLIKYQIYLDPRTNKRCEVENIIEFINKNRKNSNFFKNNPIALNLTPWKTRQINRFLKNAYCNKVSFFRIFNKKMKHIIVWGKKPKSDKYIEFVNEFISVEDGFIRSVGLGGELYPPLSLLFDKKDSL